LNTPSEEDFAAWCEHTVTRWVATAWANAADKLRTEYMVTAWSSGDPAPELLAASRAEAKAYLSLLHANRSDYDAINQDHR